MELIILGGCGFILLIFFALFSYTRKTNAGLPPGRMGLPFIGETSEFLSTGRKGHPEKFIHDRMTKYSSQIFRTSIIGERVVVVCGAAGNKFLFSNENKLVTSWWPSSLKRIFPSTAQTSFNHEIKIMAKILPNFLKPDSLRAYIGMMDTIAQRHFESSWEGRKEVVVFPLAKNYAFLVACKTFFSIDDPKRVAELLDIFEVLVSGVISTPINLPGTSFNSAIKASNLLRKEFLAIIKQRKLDLADNKEKSSPQQDILSYLLLTTDKDGQYMNELSIADRILGLLVGGHETSSVVITSILKYLAELPDIYHKVLTEQMEIAKSKSPGELLNWNDIQKMNYSWNVVCEVMRLSPPAQGAFREAIDDFIYAGFTIPKGWKLYWTVHTTYKNPEYFPEPEKFDPSRFEGKGPAPYTFVPFGGGPRMCPGKEYSRLEILIFMHNIVKRYYWEKIYPDERVIVDPLPKLTKGLPIRLLPQKFI